MERYNHQLRLADAAGILEAASKCFLSLYAFGDRDPQIAQAHLSLRETIRFAERECHIITVRRPDPVKAKPRTAAPIRDYYAFEGAAGLGKTTLLGEHAGGDLTELRRPPWSLLAGTTDDFAYFRVAVRIITARSNIIDRSDWLAPLVYNAYQRGFLFLFDEPDLQDFIRDVTPYEVILIDEPTLSDNDLHQRIVNRGGLDCTMPLEYTVLTRELFRIAARHYGLRTLTLADAKSFIEAVPKVDCITGRPFTHQHVEPTTQSSQEGDELVETPQSQICN